MISTISFPLKYSSESHESTGQVETDPFFILKRPMDIMDKRQKCQSDNGK